MNANPKRKRNISGDQLKKYFESMGIPTRELKCGTKTTEITTKLFELGIILPHWFRDSFTTQIINHNGERYFVHISVTDAGIRFGTM